MSPIIGMQGSQIALLLGIGLFVLVLLKRIRRGFGETKDYRSQALRAASRFATSSKQQESWEVEMHALARQLKGEIDTKVQVLERLIQTADEARGELVASIERAESLGLLEEHHLASVAVERSTSDEFAAAPAGRTVLSTRAAAPSTRFRLGENLGDDPRFERVYALADAGFSAARIASQVGSQVGEVELILSLRRSQ
ncbi:MAG: hypothetical protein WD894_01690 [Pirellulales bacterium]